MQPAQMPPRPKSLSSVLVQEEDNPRDVDVCDRIILDHRIFEIVKRLGLDLASLIYEKPRTIVFNLFWALYRSGKNYELEERHELMNRIHDLDWLIAYIEKLNKEQYKDFKAVPFR